MAVELISVQNIFRASNGNITLTIPADCEAAYVFLGGNYSSTGASFTGTLAGTSPDASVMSPGQSGYTQGGCLAFISPPTGSQTLAITFSASVSMGFTGQAMYVKGGDYTDGWRDAGTSNKTGTTQCSVTIDSSASDLVLALHTRISSYPAPPTGWTQTGSNTGYNSCYGIGQSCNSPGVSTTAVITAYSNYSNITGISIPAASSGPTETEVESFVEAGVSVDSDSSIELSGLSEVEAGVSVDSDTNVELSVLSEVEAGVSVDSDAEITGEGASQSEAGVEAEAEAQATYNVVSEVEAGVSVTSDYDLPTETEVESSLEAGVSITSDAVLEQVINYSDDFTGSNGDPPDSTKWEVISNDSNRTSIQSNALYCNFYPGAGVSYTFDMRGKYLLSGAFDIQVDLTRLGGAYEGLNYTWAVLEVIDEDGTHFKNVGWHYGNGGADYKYRVGDNTGGTPQGYLAGYWESEITKLRLVRDESGNVTAYVWDSANTHWEFLNSTDGYTFSTSLSGPVRVRIAFYGIGTGQLNYTFDNFLINSGETEVAPQLAVTEVEAGVNAQADTEAIYNVVSEVEAGVSGTSDAQTAYGDVEVEAGVNVVSDAHYEGVESNSEVGAKGWSDAFLLAENQFEFVRVSAESDADYATVLIDPEAGVAVEVDASLNRFVETDSSEIGVEALADAYNYAAWLKANSSKAQKVFTFTLTGSPDVEIPIASFQAQKKNGEPTYLSVVIPGFEYISDITERASGSMIVYAGFKVNGEVQVKEEIIRADLDDITYYNGPRSKSIVLSGYKTNSFFSKNITLEKPVTVTLRSGKLQIDFGSVDLFLNPGDVLTVDSDTFTVGSISYQVNTDRESMSVMETA